MPTCSFRWSSGRRVARSSLWCSRSTASHKRVCCCSTTCSTTVATQWRPRASFPMACAEPAGRTLRVVSLPGLPHSSLNWSVGRKAIAQEVRSNSCDLYAGSMSPAFAMNSVKSIRDSSHLATITLRLQKTRLHTRNKRGRHSCTRDVLVHLHTQFAVGTRTCPRCIVECHVSGYRRGVSK